MPPLYHPDFEGECRICDASPTVKVVNHSNPDTELCGTCFFGDREMSDWEDWNNQPEDT